MPPQNIPRLERQAAGKRKWSGLSFTPEGWFSRRHKTNDANTQSRERYQQEHGRRARQRKAAERLEGADQ